MNIVFAALIGLCLGFAFVALGYRIHYPTMILTIILAFAVRMI